MSFKVPEKYRFKLPSDRQNADMWNSPKEGDLFGVFQIPTKNPMVVLYVIATDSYEPVFWEHVSVSVKHAKKMTTINRTPTWEEMCRVKDLFWDKEDCVVQFHPPEREYVSEHHYTLHLWRKEKENFETPPAIAVGAQRGQKI